MQFKDHIKKDKPKINDGGHKPFGIDIDPNENLKHITNPDGSYDITLKVNSVGDVIESLKINLPVTDRPVSTTTAASSPSTLQALIQQYQDEPVPQNDFYNTLFPIFRNSFQCIRYFC